ncbi:MAG: protein-disulfide reductase DsbD family protein [Phycisphaerales bacterium]
MTKLIQNILRWTSRRAPETPEPRAQSVSDGSGRTSTLERQDNPLAHARGSLAALAVAFLLALTFTLAPQAWAGPSAGKDAPAAAAPVASADEEEDEDSPVRVSAFAQRTWVTPDGDILLAVVIDHQNKFHTWPAAPAEGETDLLPKDIAEFAIRTRVTLAEQPAWVSAVGTTQYPVPHPAKVADPSGQSSGLTVPCYSDRAVAFIPLVVKPDAPLGPVQLRVAVTFQACNDQVCMMPQDVTLDVPIEIVSIAQAAEKNAAAAALVPPAANADDFKTFNIQRIAELRAGKNVGTVGTAAASNASQGIRFDAFGLQFTIDPRGTGLILLLLAAFVGGIILNFTPCVLPVIPLKIMGLANSAGNPAKCFYLGSVMSAGVVAFWLILGVLILTISGFTAISSLFSYPLVILGIGVFILVMGLGMFGMFTVSLPQSVYMLNPKQDSTAGSFGFGILTAILATPCTAPFMGTAAAWAAQTKSPVMVLSVFGAIGLGMAVPYFILSANPKLVSKMPSAGPASDLIKQVMGGLMIAVAMFFLGNALLGLLPKMKVIAPIMWWGIALVAAATALWMLARTIRITPSAFKRVAVGVVALVLVAVPTLLAVNMTRRDPIPWQDYEPATLTQTSADGNVVVLDFTAEWCLTCKALEQTVLRQPTVIKALNAPGVIPVKVDVTAKSAPGWQKLADMNEVGIPLLAVLKAGTGEVVFKSNAYTAQQVIDAIEKARGAGGAGGQTTASSR